MMQTKFLTDGTSVSVVQLSDETALDYLPPKIYSLQFSKLTGFYLNVIKDHFPLPEKIYGNAHSRVRKCITSYLDRPTSTGILMTGDKGTGKTLLTSLLANTVIDELDMPIVLIREAYAGEQFDKFIQMLGECCIVFDEFGKMYNSSEHSDGPRQTALLSLLDGVDKTKRLIIMTENRELDINDFMLNRPSRIYYHFRYDKLDEDSIKGYCIDYDVDNSNIHSIIDLSRRSRIFSFDMLQSIVEEHKRFGEQVEEVVDELNIDIRQETGAEIEIIKVLIRGTEERRKLITKVVAKPMSTYDYSYIKLEATKDSTKIGSTNTIRECEDDEAPIREGRGNDDGVEEIHFQMSDLAYESAGQLVYETEKYVIVAREVPIKNMNYFNLF